MRRTLVRAVLGALLVVTPSLGSATENSNAEEHAGLLHLIQTDEFCYVIGDSVRISYTVTNVTTEPIGILLPMVSCPVWLRVYAPGGGEELWVDPPGCTGEAGGIWLQPDETMRRDDVWPMRSIYTGQPIDEPGVYAAEGELFTIDSSIYFTIEVGFQVLDESSGIAPGETELPVSWGTIKAIYH